MKKSILVFAFQLFYFQSIAQVGINTTLPNAQLDIRSSNQASPANTDGLLIPKIDTFPATNPGLAQHGIMVYLTSTVGINQPGFYYWDNNAVSWISFKGNPDNDWYEEGGTTAPDDINDNMYHLGNVAIGKNTANYPLEVDSNDAEIGINHSMTATSLLTTRKGIQNVVSGASDDLIYGFYNQVRNSGNGIHYGNYSLLSSIGNGEKYGTYNRIINGSGNKYGNYNYISGGGTILNGNYNFIENATAFFQYGTYNRISNTNDTYKVGTVNSVSGFGNASHIGVSTSLSGTGVGEQVGVDNQIINDGNGSQFGVKNLFSNISNGEKKGLYTTFSNTEGNDYGIENIFNSTGTTGNQFGMRNFFSGDKSGLKYGLKNESYSSHSEIIGVSNIFSANSGSKVGLENIFNVDDASSTLTGSYTVLSGLGNGTKRGHYVYINHVGGGGMGEKTGYYVEIPSVVGGNHYGVYSSVLKPSGYAGFFLGRVSIGTTSSNNYILPLSRGTNGQIMQTDASGNVTWQNPNTVLNSFGWSTTGNSGLNASTHFIGTTDNVDVVFKRNNVRAGLLGGYIAGYGALSLNSNTTGNSNAAFGAYSLRSNTTGSGNVAIGTDAMSRIVEGSSGLTIGNAAMFYFSGPTGPFTNTNTAIGTAAMMGAHMGSLPGTNNIGLNNTVVGYRALNGISSGNDNSAQGYDTMYSNTTGSNNTAFGSQTLYNNTIGNSNIAIGYQAGYNETGSNKLYIENSNSTTPLIYGEFDTDLLKINGNLKINNVTTVGNEMQIVNKDNFNHFFGNQIFGNGGDHFIISSEENGFETGGMYADGNAVTIWSPGDANQGQAAALVYFLDEDFYDGGNTNPYDNNALRSYISPVGAYVQISDKNKKDNIAKIENATKKINQISGYTYQFKLAPEEIKKGDKPIKSSGVLAQELEKVLPEAVQKNESGEYFVDYAAITPLLIEALKEQDAKIKSLEDRLKSIEEKLSK